MSNFRLDEDFDYFLSEFGEPESRQRIDNEVINHYASVVPYQLIKYWHSLGSCAFGNGLVWLTNPADYKVTLEEWLQGTQFEGRKDLSVFARTAFGELQVWAKGRGNIMNIDAHHSVIFYRSEYEKETLSSEKEDFKFRVWWSASAPEHFDYEDDSDKPLFKRAFKKFGALGPEDMYGFSHCLALGGKETLDNLGIVKLEVYHDLAKQMKEPEIIEIET